MIRRRPAGDDQPRDYNCKRRIFERCNVHLGTRLRSEKTHGVFSSDARRISDNELRNRDAEMLEVTHMPG